MVIRILKELNENYNNMRKDIKAIKNSEMKNAISEMKNALQKMNSRLDEVGVWISDLGDKVEKTPSQSKKKIFLNENSLRDLWDNIKYYNIHILEAPAQKERKQGIKNFSKK